MSYKTNYLKSCFITLLLLLLYIVLIKTFLIQDVFNNTAQIKVSEIILFISACFILITGLVTPLSFYLAGKYTTKIKEPARPENNTVVDNITVPVGKNNIKDDYLAKKTKKAIKCNPQHKNKITQPLNTNNVSNFKYNNCASPKIEPLNTVSNTSLNVFETADKSLDRPVQPEDTNSTNDKQFKAQLDPALYYTIYISNIPYRVRERTLKELLEPFGGTIFSIHMPRDKRTKKKNGTAFIRMSKAEARNAIKELNGMKLEGRELKVQLANDHGKKPDELI